MPTDARSYGLCDCVLFSPDVDSGAGSGPAPAQKVYRYFTSPNFSRIYRVDAVECSVEHRIVGGTYWYDSVDYPTMTDLISVPYVFECDENGKRLVIGPAAKAARYFTRKYGDLPSYRVSGLQIWYYEYHHRNWIESEHTTLAMLLTQNPSLMECDANGKRVVIGPAVKPEPRYYKLRNRGTTRLLELWRVVGEMVSHACFPDYIRTKPIKWDLMQDTNATEFLKENVETLVECNVDGVGPADGSTYRYFTDGKHTLFRYTVKTDFMEVKSMMRGDSRDYVRSGVTLLQVTALQGLYESHEDGEAVSAPPANAVTTFYRNTHGMWKVEPNGSIWWRSGFDHGGWVGTQSTLGDIVGSLGGKPCDYAGCPIPVVTEYRISPAGSIMWRLTGDHIEMRFMHESGNKWWPTGHNTRAHFDTVQYEAVACDELGKVI